MMTDVRKLPGKIKVFLALYLLYLSTPLIGIALFKVGVVVKYHQVNSVILLLMICFSLYTVASYRPTHKLLAWLFVILIVCLCSAAASFNHVFETNTIDGVIGMLSLHAGSQIIGGFLLFMWLRLKSIDFFHSLLFYSGLFIAGMNMLYSILLVTGQYAFIYNYSEALGFGTYLFDMVFARPAGYFFDLHSQYYLPLFAFVLLIFNKVKVSRRKRIFFNILIIVSILVSGVKTAYLSLIALILFWTFMRFNKPRNYLILLFALLVVVVINAAMDNIAIDLIYRIFTHDVNILVEHLFEVPRYMVESQKIIFLFGGQPEMSNHVYSEVYYVTIIYYIGIIGLLLLYVIPIICAFLFSKELFVKSLVLIFAMSLIHYSVFKISVNIVATAYIYFIFYKFLFSYQQTNEPLSIHYNHHI